MATTATGDAQLFEDSFTIIDIDDAKYDRVARLKANSVDDRTQMTLDFNTELFPLRTGEAITVVLATTLNLDGSKDDDKGWRDATKLDGEATLVNEVVVGGQILHREARELEYLHDLANLWGARLVRAE